MPRTVTAMDTGPGTGLGKGELRQTMGRFCTGVTVLDGEPVGFTCQSFVSLSLDPPLILVSCANRSRSLPRIVQAGPFSANILSGRQESLGRRFANSEPDKFAGLDWRASPLTGAPHLTAALAWVDTEVRDVISGGDHTVLIGHVVAASHAPGPGEPLLYFTGGFCDLAAEPTRPVTQLRR